jgi:mRNA-degrading endonuclease toxin of MazEF toxin-antitoxin module
LPVESWKLERGAVCVALFPFTPGFPLIEILRSDAAQHLEAQLREHEDIETMEATIEAGDIPEIAISVKLRRVLLLQDATRPGREDVTVARISRVSQSQRQRQRFYQRLQAGTHPGALLLDERRQGVTTECYVGLWSVTTIKRNAILRRTGGLTDVEMRAVAEKLIATLEIDVSDYVRRLRGG